MGYACLVALMCQGLGNHRTSKTNLEGAIAAGQKDIPVVSSVGALIDWVPSVSVF